MVVTFVVAMVMMIVSTVVVVTVIVMIMPLVVAVVVTGVILVIAVIVLRVVVTLMAVVIMLLELTHAGHYGRQGIRDVVVMLCRAKEVGVHRIDALEAHQHHAIHRSAGGGQYPSHRKGMFIVFDETDVPRPMGDYDWLA